MIPKPNKPAVESKDDVVNRVLGIVEGNQSVKSKTRHAHTSLYYYKGTCLLCGRENRTIVNAQYVACSRCWYWIRRYVQNNFGKWDTKHVKDAIAEFEKPLECRFCRAKLERVNENRNLRKRRICDTCKVIWKAGFDEGRKWLLKYRRTGKGPESKGDWYE